MCVAGGGGVCLGVCGVCGVVCVCWGMGVCWGVGVCVYVCWGVHLAWGQGLLPVQGGTSQHNEKYVSENKCLRHHP